MNNDELATEQSVDGHNTVPRAQLCDWLAQVAVERDKHAFEQLFNYFSPRLLCYMRRSGATAAIAEELVQETMIEVWTKSRQYRSTLGAPSTWVFTIARNLRIDRLRKTRRQDEVSLLPLDHVSTHTPSQESRIDALQLLDRLKTLPHEQREVLLLAYMDGLSQAEISDRLRLPLGTVKSRIRLAFARVRQVVRKEL